MNKFDSLETKLMESFNDKEKIEKENQYKNLSQAEIEQIEAEGQRLKALRVAHRQLHDSTWRRKNKNKKKTTKLSRRRNRG